MALAEQPGYDAHAAARVHVEPPANGAPAQSGAAATAEFSLETELFELVDRTVRSRAARSPEIRIDRRERVPVASGSRSRGVFLASLAGASAALLGLAWVVIASLGSPFDLTSITKLGAHRALDHAAAPPPLSAQTAIAPAPVAAAKTDRGQISRPVVREPEQKAHPPATAKAPEPRPAKPPEPAKLPGPAPAKPADGPDLFSSTAMTRWKPSLGESASAPSADHRATAPHPHTAKMAAAPPQPEPRIITPVPETRPITIPGWTLREIVNGTAVVDGPGGSFRVAQGDMVPGVGRVLAIFRWGNRSMVATSQGLIAAP